MNNYQENTVDNVRKNVVWSFGLFQVGSDIDRSRTAGKYDGLSTRTDVLSVLERVIGPSLQTRRVLNPLIAIPGPAQGYNPILADDSSGLLPQAVNAQQAMEKKMSFAMGSPSFDGGDFIRRHYHSEYPSIHKETDISMWLRPSDAWDRVAMKSFPQSPWSVGNYLTAIGWTEMAHTLAFEPVALNILGVSKVSFPEGYNQTSYPLTWAYPPELLSRFRSWCRALLIAIPVGHHALRSQRDLEMPLTAVEMNITGELFRKELSCPEHERTAIQQKRVQRAKEALSKLGGEYQIGRTEVFGNEDCDHSIFQRMELPIEPQGTSTENNFLGFFSKPSLKADSDFGRATRYHVIMEPADGSRPDANYPTGPRDYRGSPCHGLSQRGFRVGVHATPATLIHEFGHLMMRRLFQWTYEPEDPADGSGVPPASETVLRREFTLFADQDGLIYAQGVTSYQLPRKEFEGPFSAHLVRTYGSGRSPIVRGPPSSTHLGCLRYLDLALAAAVRGVELPESKQPFVDDVESFTIFESVRFSVDELYATRKSGPPTIETREVELQEDATSQFKDDLVPESESSQEVSQRLRRWDAVGRLLSSPTNDYALQDRREYEADSYESYANARASYWDRVWMANTWNQARSLSGGGRPGLLRAGGTNVFAERMGGRSLLEATYAVLNACFSPTFAASATWPAHRALALAGATRVDGSWLVALEPSQTWGRSRLSIAFLCREGSMVNLAVLQPPLEVVDVQCAVRGQDGGPTLILRQAEGRPVLWPLGIDGQAPGPTGSFSGASYVQALNWNHSELISVRPVAYPPISGDCTGDDLLAALDRNGRFNLLFRWKMTEPSAFPLWIHVIDDTKVRFGEVKALRVASTSSVALLDHHLEARSPGNVTKSVLAADGREVPVSPTSLRRATELVGAVASSVPGAVPGHDVLATVEIFSVGNLDQVVQLAADNKTLTSQNLASVVLTLASASAVPESMRFAVGKSRPLLNVWKANVTGAVSFPFAVGLDHSDGRIEIQYGVLGRSACAGAELTPLRQVGATRSHVISRAKLLDLAVGLHSIQVVARDLDTAETLVLECNLPPTIRDGGVPLAPWIYLSESWMGSTVKTSPTDSLKKVSDWLGLGDTLVVSDKAAGVLLEPVIQQLDSFRGIVSGAMPADSSASDPTPCDTDPVQVLPGAGAPLPQLPERLRDQGPAFDMAETELWAEHRIPSVIAPENSIILLAPTLSAPPRTGDSGTWQCAVTGLASGATTVWPEGGWRRLSDGGRAEEDSEEVMMAVSLSDSLREAGFGFADWFAGTSNGPAADDS
jgi:hypothetical protein